MRRDRLQGQGTLDSRYRCACPVCIGVEGGVFLAYTFVSGCVASLLKVTACVWGAQLRRGFEYSGGYEKVGGTRHIGGFRRRE